MKKLASLTVFLSASIAARAELPAKVTFNDHVLPIFRNACLNCHNPDKKKAGLDLTTYQGTLQGSENGKVLNSGDPGGSLLVKCVMQTEDPKMPPKGDKLSDGDIAILKKWIEGQLLETVDGKAIAAVKNNIQVAVVSLTRPDGPPPMPKELPLDPVVHTSKLNALTALGASPWAPLVAIGGQTQIILYNTETLEPLGVLPFPEGFPTIIRFSRNGQLILTGGGRGGKSGKVVIWNVQTGERIATVGNEVDQVLAADLSADQQFVALGGPNKLVKIYATKDGRLIHSIKKHTDWVTAISYSPDGRLLASADRNGGVIIWEADKGKEYNVLAGHKGAVTGLSFMTGVVASGSEDATIKLWDVKEGREIKSWQGHPGGVQSVDFTPDGRLVSCGRDKIAKVWDQTGKQLMASEAFGDIALRAEMAGERVVAGDWTGNIRVWSVADGKRVGELSANPPTIAERLAEITKRITDAQAEIPALQKQIADAEEKGKAEMAANEEKRKADLAAAEEKRKADLTAAEARRKDLVAAVESAKAAPQQLEKRIAEAKAALPALQAARDSASTVADAAAKILAFKQSSNALPNEIDAAKREVAARVAARDAAQKALDARKADAAQGDAEVAKARSEQPAKVFAAEKMVQDNDAQIASLREPVKPDARFAAPDSPLAQEIAKAKSGIDQANARITTAQAELEKWKTAQMLQNVHKARQVVTEKQARYDQLVQTVKDAPLAVENARNQLAAAEKSAAEAPAKIKEKETVFNDAKRVNDAAQQAIIAAQAAVAEKEKALKALSDGAGKAPANPEALEKKLATLNAEIAKLREARATKTQGTPEYDAADKLVQAKKPEIGQAQAALDAVKGGAKKPDPAESKAALAELAKARDTLSATQADAKTVAVKLAAADKALATVRKDADSATQTIAKLRKELPSIEKTAKSTQAEAQQNADTLAKEIQAAKAEADKRRADYETLKASGPKSASLATPTSKF